MMYIVYVIFVWYYGHFMSVLLLLGLLWSFMGRVGGYLGCYYVLKNHNTKHESNYKNMLSLMIQSYE